MKASLKIESLSLFASLPTSQHPRDRDAPQQPKGIAKALDGLMSNGKPWTVAQLAEVLRKRGYRFTESGLTARIRDLRKRPFSRTVSVTEVQGVTSYRVGLAS